MKKREHTRCGLYKGGHPERYSGKFYDGDISSISDATDAFLIGSITWLGK